MVVLIVSSIVISENYGLSYICKVLIILLNKLMPNINKYQ